MWHWVVISLSASLLTYLVFYRYHVLRLLVRSAHVLADTSPKHVSKVAIKWLAIARATWRAGPDLLMFGLWLGMNAVAIISLWQVIESPIALEAKQAISLALLSGYAIAAVLPLVLQHRQRRARRMRSGGSEGSSAALLIGAAAALLMMSGLGAGMWKILESQLVSSAKISAASGILCSSALMSLASRFVSRQRQGNRDTEATEFSI